MHGLEVKEVTEFLGINAFPVTTAALGAVAASLPPGQLEFFAHPSMDYTRRFNATFPIENEGEGRYLGML